MTAAVVSANIAELWLDQGQIEAALELSSEAADDLEAAGSYQVHAVNVLRARALAHVGDPSTAQRLLHASSEFFSSRRARAHLALVRLAGVELGAVTAGAAWPPSAIDELPESATTHRLLGLGYGRRGDATAAKRHLAEASSTDASPFDRGVALHLSHQLDEPDLRLEDDSEAWSLLRPLGVVWVPRVSGGDYDRPAALTATRT